MSLSLQNDDELEVEREIKAIRSGALLMSATTLAGAVVLFGIVALVQGDSLKAYEEEIAIFFLGLFFTWVAYSYYSEFSIRTKRINRRIVSIEASLAEFQSNLEERLTAIEERLPCELNDFNCHK